MSECRHKSVCVFSRTLSLLLNIVGSAVEVQKEIIDKEFTR